MQNYQSNFRLVGIAEVSENKKRSETTIICWLKERFPWVSDPIRDQNNVTTGTGLDNNGNRFTTESSQSFNIKAEWLGENHTTLPPDVRRGEQVFIYQVADSASYYWKAVCRPNDLALRRLETTTWFINADPNNADSSNTRDNCYVLEVSSHDKHIVLTTSAANGEKNTYMIQLDLEEGFFQVIDDQNNIIQINSNAHQLFLKNQENSYLEIIKDVINLNSNTSINLTTKTVNVTASDAMNISASNTYTMKTTEATHTATHHSIKGLVDHDSVVAMPSMSVGANASSSAGSGSGVALLEGDFVHENGTITSPSMKITNIVSTDITTDSITWSSASGPLP